MKSKRASILFIDGVGSVGISRVWGPLDYEQRYVEPLQRLYRDVLYRHRKSVSWGSRKKPGLAPLAPEPDYATEGGAQSHISFHGDELCYVQSGRKISDDVFRAIWMGFEAKLFWWQRLPNLERLQNGQDLFDLGVGVHCGPVIFRKRSWQVDRRPRTRLTPTTAEGVALNYGKRVEGLSRSGKFTGIIVSEEAYQQLCRSPKSLYFHFGPKDVSETKGIGPIAFRELVACALPQVVITGPRVHFLEEVLRQKPHDIASQMSVLPYLPPRRQRFLIHNLVRHIRETSGVRDWLSRLAAAGGFADPRYERFLDFLVRATVG